MGDVLRVKQQLTGATTSIKKSAEILDAMAIAVRAQLTQVELLLEANEPADEPVAVASEPAEAECSAADEAVELDAEAEPEPLAAASREPEADEEPLAAAPPAPIPGQVQLGF
jgi:hypothetical protein